MMRSGESASKASMISLVPRSKNEFLRLQPIRMSLARYSRAAFAKPRAASWSTRVAPSRKDPAAAAFSVRGRKRFSTSAAVAALIAAHPDVAARLERIVLMGGGARVLGNMTPTAEFNIWYDPEAAARVFAAGIPITMVGLDVTHMALTSPGDWDRLRRPGTGKVAAAVLGMVDFYTEYHRARLGTDSTAQHDSLAVAAVVRPELLTTVSAHVDVEYVGTLTRGMTVVDLDHVGDQPPTADVGVDVDTVAFNTLLIDRVVELDRSVR